jgi:hypothetical protein
MATVKVDAQLEREIEVASRKAGLSKGEFVLRALYEAIARAKKRGESTPWELGEDLFGKVSSGRSDLSQVRARDLIATGVQKRSESWQD